jgi:Cu-processing system permease protein
MVVFSCLNPVDLTGILILLKIDMSALMGATRAVFQNFFGNQWGMW